jgi:hypothetical protein
MFFGAFVLPRAPVHVESSVHIIAVRIICYRTLPGNPYTAPCLSGLFLLGAAPP